MCMQNSSGGTGVGSYLALAGGAAADVMSGGSLTPALIAAGLSMAGTAAGAYAKSQQLRKQDQITAQGIAAQNQLQKQGESAVTNTTNSLAQSNAAVQKKSAQQLGAYQTALEQAQPLSSSASPAVPGASSAYNAEKAKASTSASDYVNAIANSAATTEGTQLERVGEGQQMASTATQLGDLQRQSNEQNYVTQLKVRATQANPWITSLGALLQGAGTAYGIASGFNGPGAGEAAKSGYNGVAGDGSMLVGGGGGMPVAGSANRYALTGGNIFGG
jgi:hypothetical protein